MAAPVNVVLPVITGDLIVGSTLTTTTGQWTGGTAGGFTFQWQQINDNTVNIEGATLQTYTIKASDCNKRLRVIVTATNITGSTSVISEPTGIVPEDWFIVEDGTGLPDAISYASLDFANQYFGRRNNTEWEKLTQCEKRALLVRATDYIGEVYRRRWTGSRVNSTQALDHPRSFMPRDDGEFTSYENLNVNNGNFFYPNNVVVEEVKKACCELALKANSGELSPDLNPIGNVIAESVDGAVSVQYSDKNIPRFKTYRSIDNLLAPFFKSFGNTVQVNRG